MRKINFPSLGSNIVTESNAESREKNYSPVQTSEGRRSWKENYAEWGLYLFFLVIESFELAPNSNVFNVWTTARL